MGCCKSSAQREIHSNTGLPQKRRKISNQQLNLPPKRTEKEEQTKRKVSRRKEIIKIREEINKIETPKNNRKKNQLEKPRAGSLKG